jgi:hypothetical protein
VELSQLNRVVFVGWRVTVSINGLMNDELEKLEADDYNAISVLFRHLQDNRGPAEDRHVHLQTTKPLGEPAPNL